MTTDHTELALDADGIPILTDLVQDEQLQGTAADNTAGTRAAITPEDISRELFDSPLIQEQINRMANDLSRDVRLHMEQSLAGAIDEAINKTLDANSAYTSEKIRKQLDVALRGLVIKVLLDTDLVS